MLLVVNIGNSNIRFAISKEMQILFSWTISTKPYKTAGEFFMLSQNFPEFYKEYAPKITDIVIGSVVPTQTQIIAKVLHNILNIKPIIVDRNTITQVKHQSNQMGTDLYANAVAGHYLYPNKTKIIIDFGTALTFTAVNSEGKILGVSIAPGVITSLNALVGNTAQLPQIELKEPQTILGSDTVTCMQSGIIYGYLSMVEGMIQRIKKVLPYSDILVISTGGLGHIYQQLSSEIQIDDKLHTIKGLCLLHKFSKK